MTSVIGGVHEAKGDYDAAGDFRTQALAMRRRIYGDEHPRGRHFNLTHRWPAPNTGDADAALEFRTQPEVFRRIYGEEHPDVATSISIGYTHEMRGDYDAALDFRTRALEMERRIYGEEHPEVATSISLIGGLHQTRGDYDAALDFRTQALEMRVASTATITRMFR